MRGSVVTSTDSDVDKTDIALQSVRQAGVAATEGGPLRQGVIDAEWQAQPAKKGDAGHGFAPVWSRHLIVSATVWNTGRSFSMLDQHVDSG
jgi:hypothetical protein